MSVALGQGWLIWAILIAVGLPVLLVVLTEVLRGLTRRAHPAAKPIRLLRNWVIPAAAVLGLVALATQSPTDQVWLRVVATIVGFLLILLLLSALNVALFAGAAVDSWRSRLPSIFVDLARLLLVVVGVALLFQFVWGADVGGLVAALGVTSIVIGLALQNAVGGVISGLLLLFEQPFQIGDTLNAGGTQGRVVEVNWRAVHIDTGAGIQIVPNASLAGSSFTNLSRPTGAHRAPIQVAFGTDDPPHEVIRLLVETAATIPWRAADEHATAEYLGGGKYTVSLPLAGPGDVQRATSLYLSWLWYAARRRGLALDNDGSDPIAEGGRLDAAVETVGQTLQLAPSERESLAAEGHLERYGAGEVVQPAGSVPDHIRFVIAGVLRIDSDAASGSIQVAQIERGDYVGQTALTREPSLTAAIASGEVTVLAIPLATLETLMRSRPALAADMGRAIEQRRARTVTAIQDAATGAQEKGMLRDGL